MCKWKCTLHLLESFLELYPYPYTCTFVVPTGNYVVYHTTGHIFNVLAELVGDSLVAKPVWSLLITGNISIRREVCIW